MNKWVGIAILVILVVAVGIYVSSRQSAEHAPEPVPPPPASEVVSGAQDSSAGGQTVCPTPSQAGSGSNQAGLLVTFGDGTSQSFCVAFEDSSINGFQLLQASGVTLVYQDYGGSLGQAVCKITSGSESDGCDYPSQDCFCDSPPNSWVFFVPDTGQTSWTASSTGVSSAYVSDGGVQAQAWGTGSPPPPSCFFSDICGTP